MVRASQLPAAKEMFTAITMIDPSYAEVGTLRLNSIVELRRSVNLRNPCKLRFFESQSLTLVPSRQRTAP